MLATAHRFLIPGRFLLAGLLVTVTQLLDIWVLINFARNGACKTRKLVQQRCF